MILSSDELEILDYLKSWRGKSVSMVEICRCAGGRNKFKDTPHWAKPLMSRLVDEKLIEVNERGHYRCVLEQEALEENYFPPVKVSATGNTGVVGDDYFPVPHDPKSEVKAEPETEHWFSPEIEALLKKAGKAFGWNKKAD